MGLPAVTPDGPVLVMLTSANAVTVTVSAQSLLPPSLSLTLLVGSIRQMAAARGLIREPAVVGVTTTATLNVPLTGRVTVPLAVQLRLLLVIAQRIVPVVPPPVVTLGTP